MAIQRIEPTGFNPAKTKISLLNFFPGDSQNGICA